MHNAHGETVLSKLKVTVTTDINQVKWQMTTDGTGSKFTQ